MSILTNSRLCNGKSTYPSNKNTPEARRAAGAQLFSDLGELRARPGPCARAAHQAKHVREESEVRGPLEEGVAVRADPHLGKGHRLCE